MDSRAGQGIQFSNCQSINGEGVPFIMLLLAFFHSIDPSLTGCPAALQQ